MSDPRLRLILPEVQETDLQRPRPQLGRVLVDDGLISATDLLASLSAQRAGNAQLGQFLLTSGAVSERELYQALAKQWSAQFVDAAAVAPNLDLQHGVDPHMCLQLQMVPWARIGNVTLVATSAPDAFAAEHHKLPAHLMPVIMAVAQKSEIERVIRQGADPEMAQLAEKLVPDHLSCRALPDQVKTLLPIVLITLAFGLGFQWLTLASLYIGLFYFAISMVCVGIVLKSSGALIQLLSKTPIFARKAEPPERLPKVSLLVPLHNETDILDHLLERLGLINYPKALLDVLLVIEADDLSTRAHLEAANLPSWMRVIVVPRGNITTKPRAMNYALPFCRGEIVGIYDAEDAPHPEQVNDVVATFEGQPKSVACVQAVLDFYNAKSNLISRMFAIEYATWFRLILPGVARMGFAIPLGGTSVFFRREALDSLHGWDAHNVTEDADLGIRLARAGYSTVLIDSVTYEEANCAAWPWIKQRSRWLKGYLITYMTHMRNPLKLLFELGAWRFLGFQAFFLSSISQYLLAPLIWSCMAFYFGTPDWFAHAMPEAFANKLVVAFALMWCISTAVYMTAVSGPLHRHLLVWTLGMSLYMTMGTLAIYKGAWEILRRPFYWDKTQHGTAAALELDQTVKGSEASASSLRRVTNATEI